MRSLVLAACATACVLWVGAAAAGPAKPSVPVATPALSGQSQTPAAVAPAVTISQYSAQLFGGSQIASPAQGLPCRLVSRSEIEPEICKRRVLE